MDVTDKKASKAYRKILTSNEVKAYMVYEKLNDEMKKVVRSKMLQNGSIKAMKTLNLLQKV